MRRRKLFVALAGLTVVAAGAVVLWPRADRVTEENFYRLQDGMTRAEVEAILGPPGDYSTWPLEYAGPSIAFLNRDIPHPVGEFVRVSYLSSGQGQVAKVEWRGDCQLICVYFNSSGHVHGENFCYVARMEQTAFDNLLWRVKRQWHRWFPE
jgi:hypothetical protein